jgi:hypothetical protein
MGWKDKKWKPEVMKLEEGDNHVLFLDEGAEVEGQFGEQVLFRVQPLGADWNEAPGRDVEKLYIGSPSLLEAMKVVPKFTGKAFNIVKKGSGRDTTYEIKPRP